MKTRKQGKVVSDRQNKTIVVEVESRVQHPLYKKYITRKKKFYAHDESNEASVGDIVQIVANKPISKKKRWRLEKVVQRGGKA